MSSGYCKTLFSITFLFAVFGPFPRAFSETLAGPASVVDGDTLTLGGEAVRLHGIDAAETGQRCITKGRRIARPGDQAKRYLKWLARAGVTCEWQERDDYGRLLATCTSGDGTEINASMVKTGLAWAFVRYSQDYVSEEMEARRQRRGVWAMTCHPPWEFRKARWESAQQRAPDGCAIKGNISRSGKKIFHMPWDHSYVATRVDRKKGERWFCNENEAVAAGWKRATR